MWLVVPGLAVIDTGTTGEPLKTAAQMQDEAALFVSLGFGDAALFDNRATDAQIMAVAAELPADEPEEDDMGIKDTILAEAEKLEEQAAALLLIAANLRAQASALETADTKADELAGCCNRTKMDRNREDISMCIAFYPDWGHHDRSTVY
jgi:hypothetical protein